MARQQVEQIQCDRCKRVELLPIQAANKPADFDATFGEKKLVFNDLCGYCKKAIETLWSELKEWDRQVKQHFGPTVGPNNAPPLEVAPDLSPPKPHSVAAGKR